MSSPSMVSIILVMVRFYSSLPPRARIFFQRLSAGFWRCGFMSWQSFNLRWSADEVGSSLLDPIADHYRDMPIDAISNGDLAGIGGPMGIKGIGPGIQRVFNFFQRTNRLSCFGMH